jgi:hypothetical protein
MPFDTLVCCEFESLEHEAFLLFNDMNYNHISPQYEAIMKHLQYVKDTYLNGSHALISEISFYDRFQHKSNNDCENLNKMKNRLAKRAARNGKKTRNILVKKNLPLPPPLLLLYCFFWKKLPI